MGGGYSDLELEVNLDNLPAVRYLRHQKIWDPKTCSLHLIYWNGNHWSITGELKTSKLGPWTIFAILLSTIGVPFLILAICCYRKRKAINARKKKSRRRQALRKAEPQPSPEPRDTRIRREGEV